MVPGKTEVQRRSVNIGVVETVRLSDDLESVVMGLRIDSDAADLLRDDTQFWVVRPRVGGAGISGLGTIVSGAYIEIDPGSSNQPRTRFVGLEQPPVTPQGVPGLRLQLVAGEAGSLAAGASVVYKGITVGKIEGRTFVPEQDQVIFDLFIDERYEGLVTSDSRFWNTSGVDLELSANGFHVRTGSLEALISGGVEFDTPRLDSAAKPVVDGTVFNLYESRRSVEEVVLKQRLSYLLMFSDSVRGLSENAPVEFRGIRVGTVTGISFEYAPADPLRRVPVLIRIDPAAMGDAPVMTTDQGVELIERRVEQGLRATLKTGSLLTGQLFIDLKLDADSPPAEVGMVGKYRTLPTVSSGLGRLEDKLVLVLEKINNLPVEDTLDGATQALAEIQAAAKTLKDATGEVEALLASEGIQNLPARIDAAMSELNKTMAGFQPDSILYRDLTAATADLSDSLRSIRVLADTIERKPNSVIFGKRGSQIKAPSAKPR